MRLYDILPEPQARALGEQVAKSGAWTTGRARTEALTGTVKQNSEILNHAASQTIGKRLSTHRELQLDCIPLRLYPPKFSRYAEGQHYKLHTDAPWMGETRTDLSCTLWLSDDYGGGELCIAGQEFRGKPGQALIYDCGEPHEVKPVTSGERICAITWIESRVRDPHKRRLVSDFRRFLSRFEDDQALFVEGGRIHSALLRMWIE